jgi:hypothetical protein
MYILRDKTATRVADIGDKEEKKRGKKKKSRRRKKLKRIRKKGRREIYIDLQ